MTDVNVEGAEVDVVDSVEGGSIEIKKVETDTIESDDSDTAEQDDSAEQGSETEDKTDGDEKWPKKAVNALANAKKQASKYREKSELLTREIESLRQTANNTLKFDVPEPNENDFETYTDYIKAHSKWSVKQGVAESRQEQVQDRLKDLEGQHQTVYKQEREAHISGKAHENASKYSDYVDVIQRADPIQLSNDVENMFLALEDAPLAYYNLAKEGRLEMLSRMPIEMARIEIIQAQYRHNVPTGKTKQISDAPPPISATKKGVSYDKKPLAKQSWAELQKSLNLKK